MTADALATIRERLALHPEVELALLFGSTARGVATARSDVDVAVLAPPAAQLAVAADLALALGREVDVLDLDRAPLPVLERIVKEGVLVREARPGVSASWRSRTLAMLETDLPGFHRMRDAWLRRVAERGL